MLAIWLLAFIHQKPPSNTSQKRYMQIGHSFKFLATKKYIDFMSVIPPLNSRASREISRSGSQGKE